jgi:hypothetical protein
VAATNKDKIAYDIIQTYELTFKALQEERKAKDALIASQQAQIVIYEGQVNCLMRILEQREPFQQTINLQNSQFAGGFINAETVQSQHIGGNIHNIDNQERSN